MGKKIFYKLFILILLLLVSQQLIAQTPPYPQSNLIDSIDWHWDTYYYTAPGSDLWPFTWGVDNNLYTSWGDGGGFGGTNTLGRVSLGFARIEGSPSNLNPYNLWGGFNPENPATFDGKCIGMISVNGKLYGWINTQNGTPPDIKLAWSTDLGATWSLSDWEFPDSGSFFPSSFINFGKDNANSRDDYIYSYGGLLPYAHGPQDDIYLMRVHKDQILDRSAYEFFTGLNNNGIPQWSLNISERQPVFTDSNGVSDGLSVIYNPAIQQYMLTVGHRPPGGNSWGTLGRLGVFVAPEPWGPWSTVAYYNNWGNFGDIGEALGYHIPIKWISEDGKTFWVIFSSESYLDRFNMVRAELIENTGADSIVVNAKAFLQGAYYTTGLMRNNLNNLGYLPTSQPYNTSPWNYNGLESVNNIPSGDIVDWILIELRSNIQPSSSVSKRAAFIKRNGSIVDLDGSSPVKFNGVAPGDYYLVITHRNHLDIMSANLVQLSQSSALYNFSTSQTNAYGITPMIDLGNNIYGMISGDINASDDFDPTDLLQVRLGIINSATGYLLSDVNLSGAVNAVDLSFVKSGLINGYSNIIH